MSDDTPTPVPITARQPSGSINVGEAYRADCLRMADRLIARGRAIAVVRGEPVRELHRIAAALRDVARRVECWHSAPPGYASRTSPVERAQDVADLTQWYDAAHAALVTWPEP